MSHLAQLNIAKARYRPDDPRFADFVAAIDSVNAAAEESPGFIWRFVDKPGEPPSTIYDDDRYLVNLSVWESIEALLRYVSSGAHLAVMRRRNEWFEPVEAATLVLWWIPRGTMPTVAEAEERLNRLRTHGPTVDAFEFRTTFSPPA